MISAENLLDFFKLFSYFWKNTFINSLKWGKLFTFSIDFTKNYLESVWDNFLRFRFHVTSFFKTTLWCIELRLFYRSFLKMSWTKMRRTWRIASFFFCLKQKKSISMTIDHRTSVRGVLGSSDNFLMMTMHFHRSILDSKRKTIFNFSGLFSTVFTFWMNFMFMFSKSS